MEIAITIFGAVILYAAILGVCSLIVRIKRRKNGDNKQG
jgi:hypothetical protein